MTASCSQIPVTTAGALTPITQRAPAFFNGSKELCAGGPKGLLVEHPFKQNRAEVTFARIRQDDDECLPLKLFLLSQAHGRGNGSAARNTREYSFLTRQAPRHLDRFVVRYLFHAIDHGKIERVRNK